MDKELKFPDKFFWGSSVSSHQVEGNNFNNWTEWEKNNAEKLAKVAEKKYSHLASWPQIKDQAQDPKNYISGDACDFWNCYEQDFDLLKKLNQNAFRLSIEWSRIEPEQGKFDQQAMDYYKKMIAALRQRNIEPFVTLWHFTNPVWFDQRGSWKKIDSSDFFLRYAEFVVKNLGDLVKYYITFNELGIYATTSFVFGDWPHPKNTRFLIKFILRNLVRAHKKSYQLIHKLKPEAQVGIAKNNAYFKGWPLSSYTGWLWNHMILKRIRHEQDFIGLNYYFKFDFWNRKKEKISDLGTEIYPQGIYKVLMDLKQYRKPIYVTENGLADAADNQRQEFISEHLKYIHQAIQKGVDVKGYFHWSLLDNFEWDKGFWPRFGLIEVDFKTQERKIRSSAEFYSQICKNNKLEI